MRNAATNQGFNRYAAPLAKNAPKEVLEKLKQLRQTFNTPKKEEPAPVNSTSRC